MDNKISSNPFLKNQGAAPARAAPARPAGAAAASGGGASVVKQVGNAFGKAAAAMSSGPENRILPGI